MTEAPDQARSPHEGDAREAWRQYLSVGALPTDLLRPATYRAWERCHAARVDPRRPRAERLSSVDEERTVRSAAALIDAARPYMRALSIAAGEAPNATMLADPDGVVLRVVADAETGANPDFPGPGSILSEEVAGANGVGTPLVEDDYATLVGPEHFIGGFHPFTCQGLPLKGADGRVFGVLSTSIRDAGVSARVRAVLIAAARGIEVEPLRAELEAALRRAEARAAQGLGRLGEDVVQALAAAQVRLGSASRAAARDDAAQVERLGSLAQDAIERFRRRAALCLAIAAPPAPGAPSDVSLEQVVLDVIDLLQTELTVRRVTPFVDVREPVDVIADPMGARLNLFTSLVSAIDAAAAGGSLMITVARHGTPPLGQLRIVAMPGPGAAGPERELLLRWPASPPSCVRP